MPRLPVLFVFVTTLSACSTPRTTVYADPAFRPGTTKQLQLVIEDKSGLGELTKQPALMRMTSASVIKALRDKGYNVTDASDSSQVTHTLRVQIEPDIRSKRYIPFPVTVRRLPVACEILTADTGQQLKRAVIDGYRPYGSSKAPDWIDDPSKLYPIAIQAACVMVLTGTTPGQ